MSQALVQIDSAASATLSATAVIPVLNGAVTGTGGAIAAQVTLSDLKTYFEGGTADEFILTVALATPSALTATQFSGFASTVSGATLMGYGTTGDVTLKNRAGTDVLVVTSNTLNVTLAGALAMSGALSGVTTLAIGGALSGATTGAFSSTVTLTGLTYTTDITSATARATPSAFAATKGSFFASTVSGATLMGFGTTGDVTLKNSAGTDVIVVTANTTGVTMAGALAIVGALSGVTTLAVSSTSVFSGAVTVNAATTLGTAAGTDLTTIGGTGYGAGVASIRLNGLTTAAVTNQTGTLLNAPVAGNPNFWIPVSIAGTIRYLPAW